MKGYRYKIARRVENRIAGSNPHSAMAVLREVESRPTFRTRGRFRPNIRVRAAGREGEGRLFVNSQVSWRWRSGRRGVEGNERNVWAYAAWLASLRFTFVVRTSPFCSGIPRRSVCSLFPSPCSLISLSLSLSFHPREIDVARLSNDCARTDNRDGAYYVLVGRRKSGGGRTNEQTNERTRGPNDDNDEDEDEDEDEDGDGDVGEHGSQQTQIGARRATGSPLALSTYKQPSRVVNSDKSCRVSRQSVRRSPLRSVNCVVKHSSNRRRN